MKIFTGVKNIAFFAGPRIVILGCIISLDSSPWLPAVTEPSVSACSMQALCHWWSLHLSIPTSSPRVWSILRGCRASGPRPNLPSQRARITRIGHPCLYLQTFYLLMHRNYLSWCPSPHFAQPGTSSSWLIDGTYARCFWTNCWATLGRPMIGTRGWRPSSRRF